MTKYVGFVLALTAYAQTRDPAVQSKSAVPASQTFEVATVKPSNPGDRGGRYIVMQSVNRFVVKNYSLHRMLSAAYGLHPRAISGGPEWVNSDPYDVLATTPGDARPPHDEQMVMLRQLLDERFRLALHRVPKVMPVYVLTLAKTGSKLKDSTAPATDSPALINTVFPDHIELPARNATMTQLAEMLQRAVLDRPVVDKTGLTGRYDFKLEWVADETQFGGVLPRVAEPNLPGLFAAVQQQLGLRLEPGRERVDTLVIDHAERPSAN